MKYMTRLSCFLLVSLFFVHPASALVLPSVSEPSTFTSPDPVKPSPFAGMTMKDFITMTPKRYEALSGKRMSFGQKLSFKMAQRKIKKASRKNSQVLSYAMPQGIFDASDFNVAGFVLGLLLPVIGILIAYLIEDPSVVKWAWIGFSIWAVIFIIILIL